MDTIKPYIGGLSLRQNLPANGPCGRPRAALELGAVSPRHDMMRPAGDIPKRP